MARHRAPKKSTKPIMPPGVELHYLPVNQAYLVTWKGDRVCGPCPKSEALACIERMSKSPYIWGVN